MTDNTDDFILADRSSSGHFRLTHKGTGKTLVRQPFMTDRRWEQEEEAFLLQFPNAPIVLETR